MFDTYYFAVNLGVGLGIALDAMVATLGRYRRFDRGLDAVTWAAAIGATHWLFPLVGFMGGWYAVKLTEQAATIYFFGGCVMLWFTISVLRGAMDTESDETGSALGFWVAVWTVSIDAIVSGPGKTAATEGWTEAELWVSFPLVGVVVFALVLASAYPAILLRRRWAARETAHAPRLAAFYAMASLGEIAIFSFFALLAFVQSLRAAKFEISSPVLWVMWLISCGIVALFFGRRVLAAQRTIADLQVGTKAAAPS